MRKFLDNSYIFRKINAYSFYIKKKNERSLKICCTMFCLNNCLITLSIDWSIALIYNVFTCSYISVINRHYQYWKLILLLFWLWMIFLRFLSYLEVFNNCRKKSLYIWLRLYSQYIRSFPLDPPNHVAVCLFCWLVGLLESSLVFRNANDMKLSASWLQ